MPHLLTVADFESAASNQLSPLGLGYLQCGVADEFTLARNRSVFSEIRLNPRVLVDVSQIDTSFSLFGRQLPFPILLAPVGYHKLFHSEGELETVRGANRSEALLVAAVFSTVAFEEMAAEAEAPLGFQLYFQPERDNTRRIVDTAIAAGCAFLCLTVDVPVNGPRDREARTHFALPSGAIRANLKFLGEDLAGAAHRPNGGRNIYAAVRSPKATWADVEWLRSVAPVPLMLKGILNGEDAVKAVDAGCDAIVVSNHGARSVDTVPAALEALPFVVEAVRGRVPVLLDGGIRRGSDVFKALAFGAAAVLIGRPYLYGLAVAGASGVAKVIEILRTELEMTMGLTGCQNLQQINRDRIWPY